MRTQRHTLILSRQQQRQQGVALIVALFVLLILSIISLAIFLDSQGELKRSGIARNSERALKLAETGVQVARSSLEEGGLGGSLASVDGFAMGGYFLGTLGSGMPGTEKWEQWHYDSSITGNNIESEITTPLRPVWMKESYGRNGVVSTAGDLTITNLYAIVSGGAYFPIEAGTATEVRAVDEFTGQEGTVATPLKFSKDSSGNWYTWKGEENTGDKSILEATTTEVGYNNDYAINMSPMASYSNFSTVGRDEPIVTQQTIYYTYAGERSTGSADATSDTTSTVRLQAMNSLCNDSTTTTDAVVLWEFDTGIHGYGTAPAVFDPSPDQPGDEIIYFAVVGQDDADLRSTLSVQRQPSADSDEPDTIYIYAIVDETSTHPDNAGKGECDKEGRYFLKWAHRYPDPDVAEWTDYPVVEVTGTNGLYPPYVRMPGDMQILPEDDLLFDYRDSYDNDNLQNHVRGNIYTGFFTPPSVSPVVVKATYELDGVDTNGLEMVTTQRGDTIQGVLSDPSDNTSIVYGDPADPLIDLYLVYVAHPRVMQVPSGGDADKALGYNLYQTYGWGRKYGLKKYSNVQTRVIALRDRLDGTCDSDNDPSNGLDGEDCAWNWNSAKSRFPIFKWNYRVPAHDPEPSDDRPWNGYGEFVWENWFEQQIAPMITTVEKDQDGTTWGTLSGHTGGKRPLYNALYVTYESLSFPDEAADSAITEPDTGDGFPVTLSGGEWGHSQMMVMGLRDTWDDYMEGRQTNPMWDAMVTTANDYAIPLKSSPVEDYWTHKHDDTIRDATTGKMIESKEKYGDGDETVITYPGTGSWMDPTNTDKVGFARPYLWNEELWEHNVDNGEAERDLAQQGWRQSGLSPDNTSNDIDIEGETSAVCGDCLDGDGLIVSVFNHDLNSIEDLRMHAINARTGRHAWDYHMPATYVGDYFNGTPAIANGKVFVSYISRDGIRQGAYLKVLDANTGILQDTRLFDNDPDATYTDPDGNTIPVGRADALIMSPSIANGAVYIGTYHLNGSASQNTIRIYAFSPVLRILSIGVYPMAYPGDSTIPDLTTDHLNSGQYVPRAERKLQVWITGAGSKWEEIRETRE